MSSRAVASGVYTVIIIITLVLFVAIVFGDFPCKWRVGVFTLGMLSVATGQFLMVAEDNFKAGFICFIVGMSLCGGALLL